MRHGLRTPERRVPPKREAMPLDEYLASFVIRSRPTPAGSTRACRRAMPQGTSGDPHRAQSIAAGRRAVAVHATGAPGRIRIEPEAKPSVVGAQAARGIVREIKS